MNHQQGNVRRGRKRVRADQLTQLSNRTASGAVLSSFDYSYDNVGNRTGVVEADGAGTWTYDNTYQLTRERRSGADSYDVTYTYDPVGNRGTMLENAVTTTYSYDAANELVTLKDNAGTTTYTYDAEGNQLTQQVPVTGTTTHTWDYENLLTRMHLPGGGRSTITYNWQDKRVQAEDAGGSSKLIWDGENLLLETDGSDVTQVVYTLEPEQYGNQISQRRSGATHYYHFDGLGSTDRLTDASETVTDNYTYKAFGVAVTATGSTINPFRYVGRMGYYFDTTTGLYYVRARWLRTENGRWMSRDPLGFESLDESFPNIANALYGYVSSRPTIFQDPTGLAKTPDGVDLGPTDKTKACCITQKSISKKKLSDTQTAVQGIHTIKYKAKNSGLHVDGKSQCCCDCCLYRQFIKGWWRTQKWFGKQYEVRSCGNLIKIRSWTEEYINCIYVNRGPCDVELSDAPGWRSGLANGQYV